MYTEKVMDHFTNPRNVGEIENAHPRLTPQIFSKKYTRAVNVLPEPTPPTRIDPGFNFSMALF